MKVNREGRNTMRYMTLHDVAAEMGITAERVRQIEAKALYKLKKLMAERGIDAAAILPPNYDEARA